MLLKKIAESAHFECEVFNYSPSGDSPILLVTWPGSEPSLPCLLLNSHMDVVPALRVRSVSALAQRLTLHR